MTQADYAKSIEQAFLTIGKQVIAKSLSNAGLGIFAGPLSYLASIALSFLIKQAEMAVFFLYTDMMVGAQGKDLEAAMLANRNAQNGGTDAEKQLAEKNLITAFDKLVRFNL